MYLNKLPDIYTMYMEELKLTFKVRPIATVRRAVSFKLFKDPSEVRAK